MFKCIPPPFQSQHTNALLMNIQDIKKTTKRNLRWFELTVFKEPVLQIKCINTCNEETESHFRHMTREHIGQRKSTQWHEHELSYKPDPRS